MILSTGHHSRLTPAGKVAAMSTVAGSTTPEDATLDLSWLSRGLGDRSSGGHWSSVRVVRSRRGAALAVQGPSSG